MDSRIMAMVAAAFAVGSTQIASAADIPAPQPTPVYRAPAVVPVEFSWTGCYLGANGGWHYGLEKITTSTPLANYGAGVPAAIDLQSPQTIHPNGFTVGGQAGCNVQFGVFVVGIEGDGQWLISSKTSRNIGFSGAAAGLTIFNQVENTWFATARARMGMAFDRTLIYVTGGGAFAGLKTIDALVPPPTATVTGDATRTGWTGGGGIEYAFAFNWTVKAEYLYSDLGTLDVTIPGATTVHHRYTDHNVRGGLNYKF